MTLVKFNRSHDDFFPRLSRMLDDFVPTFQENSSPAVNIKETDNSFELELAVPGLSKEDFDLSIDENVLKISAEKEVEKEEKNEQERYSRREFSYHSFSRAFTLPETVKQDEISANYKEGILFITLPKQAEAKVSRSISIN